ncbi:NAD(P)/FAD-dependent oxidoreductase [Pseudonocardia alaniniphila]|uniref:NAD(P)/FAD-dependent oxidoreductase n=1 Tax=Pseudonocardia alaniniphila TaxID=75291 RepID=A0ABS9TTA7_9PSEU|nr:FAD/NAD(P)-binding oxidoreductase [Pseudonocardia alaniniphila]MCH6171792.1 NAD(P)/FAD-dependent oxidoreductase [Pseudonocardia alaniniphila]
MIGAARVVVVGASRAGTTVVGTLRARGFTGSITLVGDEDVMPYDRTHLSKEGIRNGASSVAAPLCGPDDLVGTDLRLGTRAVGVDSTSRTVHLDDGSELPYDGLFVATGSAPRRPHALSGCDGVYVLRTFADAQRLRAALARASTVLIVGGGFVGAEIAVAARERELPVTIVEAGATLLERGLGEQVGAEWTELHRRRGVTVHCGRTVVSLNQRDGRVDAAVLDDGRVVPADLVLVGVGAAPSTDWLSGDDALKIDDGLICSETLCAAPGIYAVGDVARWRDRDTGELRRIEHWTNAHAQGRVAAGNFLGDDQAFVSMPYVWSDQYGHRLQIYGTTRNPDTVRVLDPGAGVSRLVVYEADGRVVGAVGVDAAKELLPWRRAIARQQPLDDALRGLAPK